MKDNLSYGKFIKIFVITGFSFAALALVISLALHVCAGRTGDYYLFNEISIELIHTARKCAGTTALGAYLLRLIKP